MVYDNDNNDNIIVSEGDDDVNRNDCFNDEEVIFVSNVNGDDNDNDNGNGDDGDNDDDNTSVPNKNGAIIVSETTSPNTETSETSNNNSNNKLSLLSLQCGEMNVLSLIGLGIAGIAAGFIADIFGMFYVDTFLRSYRLPLKVFGIGSAIFAVINTANDVAGAYFVDWWASRSDGNGGDDVGSKREQLVGLSGCLFAISLLFPFFRFPHSTSNNWRDGLHFVGTLSLYDTMFSFNCILQGSIVSDNHSMSDNQRIMYYALSKITHIAAPLITTKIGLRLFNVQNLVPFRYYIILLVILSCILCVIAQKFINYNNIYNKNNVATSTPTTSTRTNNNDDTIPKNQDEGNENNQQGKMKKKKVKGGLYSQVNDNDISDSSSSYGLDDDTNINGSSTNSNLQFWQVVKDFLEHPNFRYWILMEMLMEGQNTFLGNFEKTFVDQLLYQGEDVAGSWSRESCDWMLSLMDPSTQIVGLLLFIPIKRYGYARLYTIVFIINIMLASSLLLLNGISNTNTNTNTNDENNNQSLSSTDNNVLFVGMFLFSSSVLMNAMASSGFVLAMCDMVLEMKHTHLIVQDRKNAPSLAGMFMGVNALFCKPAESVLPIMAASFLSIGNDSGGDGTVDGDMNLNDSSDEADTDYEENRSDDYDRFILYRLLVFPPLICSIIQLIVWSRYSLVPAKTKQLRNDMEQYGNHQKQKMQQQQHTKDHNNNNYEQNVGYHDNDYNNFDQDEIEQEGQVSGSSIEMNRII